MCVKEEHIVTQGSLARERQTALIFKQQPTKSEIRNRPVSRPKKKIHMISYQTEIIPVCCFKLLSLVIIWYSAIEN